MTGVHFDNTEVDKLVQVLGQAGDAAFKNVRAIVAKGALNIKTDARRMAKGIAHAPLYPSSISFDLKTRLRTFEAEIGPDKNLRQGSLGNILEYGAPARNTAPHPHMLPAAVRELPRLEKALEDAAAKPLEGL